MEGLRGITARQNPQNRQNLPYRPLSNDASPGREQTSVDRDTEGRKGCSPAGLWCFSQPAVNESGPKQANIPAASQRQERQ